MRALSPDEVGRFLDAARTDHWWSLWVILLTCGLRPGEALGLEWDDVAGARLRVRRVLIPGSRGTWQFEEPKTAHSRRVVALPKLAVEALQEQRRRQAADKLRAGPAYRDHGLIFAGPTGLPVDYSSLVRVHFDKIVRLAGFAKLRVYDLRHTSATLLLAAGEHPKIVSERLGHASVTLTLDTYSHVLPDMQTRCAERLDTILTTASADG